jgi:hypothetical protein
MEVWRYTLTATRYECSAAEAQVCECRLIFDLYCLSAQCAAHRDSGILRIVCDSDTIAQLASVSPAFMTYAELVADNAAGL